MAYIQCASSFFSIRKDVFRELAIELFRVRVRIGGLCQASGTKHTSQPFHLQAPICILLRRVLHPRVLRGEVFTSPLSSLSLFSSFPRSRPASPRQTLSAYFPRRHGNAPAIAMVAMY